MFQSKFFAVIAVVFTLSLASIANATVVSNITQISADPSVVGDISNSDLINSGSAALSGVSSSGYSAVGGINVNSSPNVVLNDGVHGYRAGASTLAASGTGTWNIDYTLTGAYDIDSIALHTASIDNRIDTNFQILFEYSGNPGTFVSLGNFDHLATLGPGHFKTTLADDNSAAIGTDVTAIRVVISQGQFAPTVYSEIDVFEAGAVPEPSTFALAAFGLMGLAGWGIRRRRTA